MEAKTKVQLQEICTNQSISYVDADVKDKLIAMIAKKSNVKYIESDLASKTLSNLKAICDGLAISYTEADNEEALKTKILA